MVHHFEKPDQQAHVQGPLPSWYPEGKRKTKSVAGRTGPHAYYCHDARVGQHAVQHFERHVLAAESGFPSASRQCRPDQTVVGIIGSSVRQPLFSTTYPERSVLQKQRTCWANLGSDQGMVSYYCFF